MKPRKLNPNPVPRGARTQNDWRKLMIKVISRAQALKDPRLPMLQKAQQEGTQEACLRRMSIIGDNDLKREFPDKL